MLSLLLLVLAMTCGSTPSSAAGNDWWTPTARPAPDVRIDVTGEPFTGTDSSGKVQGSSTRTTTSSATKPSAVG